MNAVDEGDEREGEGSSNNSQPKSTTVEAVRPIESEEGSDNEECVECGEGVAARIAK